MEKTLTFDTVGNLIGFFVICTIFIFGDETANGSYLYLAFGCMGICTVCILLCNRMIYFPGELFILFLFLGYMYSSKDWAMMPARTTIMSRTLFILYMMCFLFVNLLIQTKGCEAILKSIVLAGQCVCICCVAVYGVSGLFNSILTGDRIGTGIFGQNANALGLNCSTSVVIAMYFLKCKKKKMWIFAMILPALITVASGSKKAILYIVAGCVILTALLEWTKNRQRVVAVFRILFKAVMMIIAFLLALQLPMFSFIRERLNSLLSLYLGGQSTNVSDMSRALMNKIGIEQFLKTPILGIGLNNGACINYILDYRAYLHNNYIEMLVNGGIIGVLLYYGFYIVLIIKHLRKINTGTSMVKISLTIILMQLFMDWGMVSYFDKKMVVLYALWIVVANSDDHQEVKSLCFCI